MADNLDIDEDVRPYKPRCMSCRHWERSYNFKRAERDWGLCHFWGRRRGYRTGRMFIDGTEGHEPRGANGCAWHNADPSLCGQLPAIVGPKIMREGEYV